MTGSSALAAQIEWHCQCKQYSSFSSTEVYSAEIFKGTFFVAMTLAVYLEVSNLFFLFFQQEMSVAGKQQHLILTTRSNSIAARSLAFRLFERQRKAKIFASYIKLASFSSEWLFTTSSVSPPQVFSVCCRILLNTQGLAFPCNRTGPE